MQIQDIKDLMEKMSQTGMNVLEFEAEGNRLRLERTGAAPVHDSIGSCGQPGEQHPAWMANQPGRIAAMALEAAEAAELAATEKPGYLVTSPVVGIFYAAPSPDSEPFVAKGSVVEIGSPLCIIEAMKLMNEVTSAWDGVVLEIMAENGQRVEFGQPLMRIGGN